MPICPTSSPPGPSRVLNSPSSSLSMACRILEELRRELQSVTLDLTGINLGGALGTAGPPSMAGTNPASVGGGAVERKPAPTGGTVAWGAPPPPSSSGPTQVRMPGMAGLRFRMAGEPTPASEARVSSGSGTAAGAGEASLGIVGRHLTWQLPSPHPSTDRKPNADERNGSDSGSGNGSGKGGRRSNGAGSAGVPSAAAAASLLGGHEGSRSAFSSRASRSSASCGASLTSEDDTINCRSHAKKGDDSTSSVSSEGGTAVKSGGQHLPVSDLTMRSLQVWGQGME